MASLVTGVQAKVDGAARTIADALAGMVDTVGAADGASVSQADVGTVGEQDALRALSAVLPPASVGIPADPQDAAERESLEALAAVLPAVPTPEQAQLLKDQRRTSNDLIDDANAPASAPSSRDASEDAPEEDGYASDELPDDTGESDEPGEGDEPGAGDDTGDAEDLPYVPFFPAEVVQTAANGPSQQHLSPHVEAALLELRRNPHRTNAEIGRAARVSKDTARKARMLLQAEHARKAMQAIS